MGRFYTQMVRFLFYGRDHHECVCDNSTGHTHRSHRLDRHRNACRDRHQCHEKKNRTIMLSATNIPLLNADIVTGISMMLLFVKSQQPPVQLVVCYKPSKGLCYCSPQRAVSQAFLLVRYKAVLLESSFLDSSACSFIYFCTASSVILPIVST